MLGTFDLQSELNIRHCFLAFFCDSIIDSSTFLVVLIPWVKAWHIYFACIVSLNKLRNDKAS